MNNIDKQAEQQKNELLVEYSKKFKERLQAINKISNFKVLEQIFISDDDERIKFIVYERIKALFPEKFEKIKNTIGSISALDFLKFSIILELPKKIYINRNDNDAFQKLQSSIKFLTLDSFIRNNASISEVLIKSFNVGSRIQNLLDELDPIAYINLRMTIQREINLRKIEKWYYIKYCKKCSTKGVEVFTTTPWDSLIRCPAC